MDNVKSVVAFIYKAGEDVVYAASAEEDFIVPRDISRVALDVGVWLKVVLDDQLSVTIALQPDPSFCLNGEIRLFNKERTFMVHDVGVAYHQEDGLWVCETKSYGPVFFSDHIVPLGLPDGVPIVVRRTTEDEERDLTVYPFINSRWIIEEVLSIESSYESGSSEENMLCEETEKMTLNGEPVADNVVPPSKPGGHSTTPPGPQEESLFKEGIITGIKALFRPPNFNKLAYVWTSGVIPGVEFQLLLRRDSQFVERGDYIRFAITKRHFENARADGYTIYNFERNEPRYETRAVRNTVEIFVPNISIPATIRNGNILVHPEFGYIFDRDRMLIPEKTMNIVIVRERPKDGACWRVTKATVSSPSRPSTPPVQKPLPPPPVAAQESPRCSTFDSPVRGENTPDKTCDKGSGQTGSFSSDAWNRIHGYREVQNQETSAPQNPITRLQPSLPQMQSPDSPSSRPTVRASVNVVSLKEGIQHQQADEVRSEVGVIVDKTNQKDVYAVWLTNSHVEGCLHHKDPLYLGASFLGNFSFCRGHVISMAYIEEVPNAFEGQLSTDDKIELFVDVTYLERDSANNCTIFWSDKLGPVRDIGGIVPHTNQTASVVVRRFRVSQIQGYVWCVARMKPRNDPPPPPPQHQLSHDGMLELLDTFGEFYQEERLRQLISSISPEDFAALERYYKRLRPGS